MAPPSPLAIATSSLQRLVKEEASYYKELEKQEARLKKVEESTEEDENREYTLKQEVSTPQPFPPSSILKIASLVNMDSYT
jgi:tubulin-specific chaperone A